MVELPIDTILSDIVGRLREARSLVIVAPPGAGKTTRVAPAILRAGLLNPIHPNLVMLQPRRVAARAAAQRIAEEQGWSIGAEVGYQIRFEKRIGPATRLRILTEGILNRQLLNDPSLEGIGGIILDEFHERSLHTDLAIALLREVRHSLRDDLMLVVMSATLHAEPVAAFLGGCPVIHADARMFPVEVSYLPPTGERLPQRAADAVRMDREGDVLVFLPGAEEIRRTSRLLTSDPRGLDCDVLPLHGSLPFEQQLRALRPSDRRKVILATNIAETSLTIEGVTTVIDSGYARIAGYDSQRGLDRLELKRISKASAEQRAGRAGRVAPGCCIRLWSRKEHHELAEFEQPEIMRVDLASTVLALHAWGQTDPRTFGWFEAPPHDMIASAERLLVMLGALSAESTGRITQMGKDLRALPLHPRIARLLLASADAQRLDDGATMAALLEERDIVLSHDEHHPLAHQQGPSDLLARLQLLHQDSMEGLDRAAVRQVQRTREQLLRISNRFGKSDSRKRETDANELLRWPLLAYPDRVVKRRTKDADSGVMVGGGGVRLARESVVRRGAFFVALDVRDDERSPHREALVRIASQIEVEWLEELFPQSIRHERALLFDEARQRVVGSQRTFYRDLLLHEQRDAAVDPQAAGELLAAALRPHAVEILASNSRAASWLARARFLAAALPDHDWPAFDDAMLADVIAEASLGKQSLEQVRQAPLLAMLQSRLSYQLNRLIDEQAPESIEVPSGSRIQVNYDSGNRPALAVRLQEIFGWTDTPRIAAKRVSVLLHILGPNFRPVQVTDDLNSFWKTTYAQVRKDLRVRYPKHAWPEDPMTARPQAKGGARR